MSNIRLYGQLMEKIAKAMSYLMTWPAVGDVPWSRPGNYDFSVWMPYHSKPTVAPRPLRVALYRCPGLYQ